jgi:hypothetical protein
VTVKIFSVIFEKDGISKAKAEFEEHGRTLM